MKRAYTKPTMEVIDAGVGSQLLAGSSEDTGNPYWEGPGEPEEGCQSNWWCGK